MKNVRRKKAFHDLPSACRSEITAFVAGEGCYSTTLVRHCFVPCPLFFSESISLLPLCRTSHPRMITTETKKDDLSRSAVPLTIFYILFILDLKYVIGIGCQEHQHQFRLEMGGGMSPAKSHRHLHYRHPYAKVYVTGAAKEARKYITSIVGNSYLLASLFPAYSIILYVDDDDNFEAFSDWSAADDAVSVIKGDYKGVQVSSNELLTFYG
jgi:hypothetical protein